MSSFLKHINTSTELNAQIRSQYPFEHVFLVQSSKNKLKEWWSLYIAQSTAIDNTRIHQLFNMQSFPWRICYRKKRNVFHFPSLNVSWGVSRYEPHAAIQTLFSSIWFSFFLYFSDAWIVQTLGSMLWSSKYRLGHLPPSSANFEHETITLIRV